jgi:hypothetical protein
LSKGIRRYRSGSSASRVLGDLAGEKENADRDADVERLVCSVV